MAKKRVGMYQLSPNKAVDYANMEEALMFLYEAGKLSPHIYDDGKICFHHKGHYFFLKPDTFSWCRRDKANTKWRRAKSLPQFWEDLQQYVDFINRPKTSNFNPVIPEDVEEI